MNENEKAVYVAEEYVDETPARELVVGTPSAKPLSWLLLGTQPLKSAERVMRKARKAARKAERAAREARRANAPAQMELAI